MLRSGMPRSGMDFVEPRVALVLDGGERLSERTGTADGSTVRLSLSRSKP